MSIIAIILIIISAILHASWNLLSKKKNPSPAFFLFASFVGILLFSPTAFLWPNVLFYQIFGQVWLLVTIAGFFQAMYYISLAGAYKAGNMSVAYPLARSSPVIVVTIVTLFLGQGDQLTALCFAGIILVVFGSFLIPMHRFREFSIRNYLNLTCSLALVAAIGTSGYSITDDEALKILRSDETIEIGGVQLTLLYFFLENMITTFWLALFVLARKSTRNEFRKVLEINKKDAALTGVIIGVCYAIILVSMAYANNISYVVGFRQLSIPLGTMLSIMILNEPAYRPKLIGVGIVFVGLILVAVG